MKALANISSSLNINIQKPKRTRKKCDSVGMNIDLDLDCGKESGLLQSFCGCKNRCNCINNSVKALEGTERKRNVCTRRKKKGESEEQRGMAGNDTIHGMNTLGSGLTRSSSNIPVPNVINESNELGDSFAPLHHLSGGKIVKSLEILKSRGIVPNTGAWTTTEVNRLQENMMEYLRAHTVKSFPRLIIPHTKEEKKFRRDTEFLLKMCKGIRRTQINVSNRIVAQYSNFLNRGSMSDKEKHEIVTLGKSGKSWKDIGIMMNRSCHNLGYFYFVNSRSWNYGPWSGEEDDLLRKAVESYKSACGEDKGSWMQISEMVGTRDPRSCLNRWNRHLSKCMDTIEDIIFNKNNAKELVSMIFDSNYEDDYLIDWTVLSTKFHKTVTPAWLRWKWGVLMKEIPHSHFLEFTEVVEKLHELYTSKEEDSSAV